MKEYFGDSAKLFTQTGGKKFLANPALERAVPDNTKTTKLKLLDVGCGYGFFYEIAVQKNYEYFGIDISEDMIERARQEFPDGHFSVNSALDFSKDIKEKFDVIVVAMVYPAFHNGEDIVKSLKECKKVLAEGGKLVLQLSHPCFDFYMQKGILGRDEIETDFKGYFESGQKMICHLKYQGGTMSFEDYHFTISDYFKFISSAGLSVCGFDECKPIDELKIEDPKKYEEKLKYPTYLVLKCSIIK